MFLKILQYHLCWSLLLIKATLLKRDSDSGVFCEYRESLKKSFFYRTHPALAGSVVYWVFKGYLRYKIIFLNKVALAVY